MASGETPYRTGNIALVKGQPAMLFLLDLRSADNLGWVMPGGQIFPHSTVRDEVGPTLVNVADIPAGWVSPEQYRDQVKHVAVLRTWKDEAMEVMSGLEDLGKALGLPLGEQITGTAAAETAVRLSARLAEVRAIHHEWGETDADDINQQALWERIGHALTREEASNG